MKTPTATPWRRLQRVCRRFCLGVRVETLQCIASRCTVTAPQLGAIEGTK